MRTGEDRGCCVGFMDRIGKMEMELRETRFFHFALDERERWGIRVRRGGEGDDRVDGGDEDVGGGADCVMMV